MQRLPDWETLLAGFLDATAETPFEYGRSDCALFVADAVLALTGEDFGAPFRGKYRSAAGAVRALRQHGAGDLDSTITAALGEPIHPAFAQRGDIIMAEGGVGPCAGVCIGADAAFLTDAGHMRLPCSAWLKAWRV